MAAILLWMPGFDAFNTDAQSQPPDGQLGEVEQPVRGSERNAVIGTNGLRQASFFEQPLEGSKRKLFAIGFHGLAQQQVTRGMVGHGQRMAILVIAQPELAFVIGAPELLGVRPQESAVPSACVRDRLALVTNP